MLRATALTRKLSNRLSLLSCTMIVSTLRGTKMQLIINTPAIDVVSTSHRI
ncbi:MAG: hypothetical protein HFG87_03380 [Dorea sp.]|nr:hypothetical protein [Dorea sp.]